MVDYIAYPPTIHHDFELYSNNQEQAMDYPLTNQPFMPSSTYSMGQTFNAPYDPMMPLAEAPRLQDLHFHYDGIAQGVKPFQFHTPAGSPHSTSHAFHEQPPILSASSESGASVSSSALGSPTHFPESWNPMGLGLTSSFEYPGILASEKTFVGESTLLSTTLSFSPPSPTASLSEGNGIYVVRLCDVVSVTSSSSIETFLRPSHALHSSCWFSSVLKANLQQQ
jgi:hypothetical protein